jgi:hypothetical protein
VLGLASNASSGANFYHDPGTSPSRGRFIQVMADENIGQIERVFQIKQQVEHFDRLSG